MQEASFAALLRHQTSRCRCRESADGARPFAFPNTPRAYERDRPFRIEHIALDLALDFPKKRVEGVAKLRVRRVDATARRLRLDAIAFTSTSVTIDGAPVGFDYDDEVLSIEVPRKARTFEVAVSYRVEPRRGLYFLAPDDHVRDRPLQVWSQGQDEDARCWFPCHDSPHEKQTTELRVRVPRGFQVLSNGVLVEQRDEDESTIVHYKQDLPHPSYLVTLVVGRFATIEEDFRIPLSYLVPAGREQDARRTFARTREMMELFERKTAVPFPWSKYAQVVVSDFLFGGMENTSATTLYEYALIDERAALDVDMESLVAHELAHQWFGNYVTCRSWSEGWLNEGWATYMELVWKEEGRPGEPGFGRDEYDYAVKGELDAYLAEDRARYRRTLVCRDYDAPIDLFDRHLYQKGGAFLHVLRRFLGDEPFWQGVRSYLQRHAFGVVESRDFQRALEESSGRSLDRLFDAYVYGAGHPDFEVTIRCQLDEGSAPQAGGSDDGDDAPANYRVEVEVEQKQPHQGEVHHYRGDLIIDLAVDGRVDRRKVSVLGQREVYVFELPERPEWVAVDPEGDLLATFEVKAPGDMLRRQLKAGTTARIRWSAAAPLGKRDDPATVDALGETLADPNEFWGVRVEAADALAQVRGSAALERLKSQTNTEHPKVRRAVARALGAFTDETAVTALRPLALGDPSYLVSSEAARALGATRQAPAYETLLEVLDRRSWADVVRAGAAEGIGSLRDERGIPHLVARTAYGHEGPGRRACMTALAKLDPSRKTRELLEQRLDDVDPFVRIAAARALEIVGDPAAKSAIAQRLEREGQPSVRRRLREVLHALSAPPEHELRRLREELEKYRSELQEVRTRVSRIEAAPTPRGSITDRGGTSRKAAASEAAKSAPRPTSRAKKGGKRR